jgi:LysR family transcriptional regulator, glycine cleavage system transcriptional activator
MLEFGVKRQLPPLNSLIVAETAARLGSFRAASDELHVTASAVSHQIRSLESWLGFRLFNRSVRSVGLTEAGRRYLFEVSALLDDLSRRTKMEIARSGKGQVLTVQTTDSFANRWLVARLPDFIAQHRGTSVQIVTFEYTEGFRPSEADMAVLYGRGKWPNSRATLLLEETIFPVSSPNLTALKKNKSLIEGIADYTLLHDDNLGVSWQEWWSFAEGGAALDDSVDMAVGPHFNHSHLSLLAAELGSGVTLASWPLVIDALNEGSLVALSDKRLKTGFGYYILESTDAATRERCRTFVDWLSAQPPQSSSESRVDDRPDADTPGRG